MWNDFIIIDYYAGSGGEFFAGLLYKSYDPAYVFVNINNSEGKNTFVWFDRPSYHSYDIRMRKIDSYISHYNGKTELSEPYKKVFDEIYDEDPNKFVQNFYSYFRRFYSRFKSRPFIEVCTYTNKFRDMCIGDMFPGSAVLFLEVDKKYMKYVDALDTIKNNLPSYYASQRSLRTFDDMIPIDAGRLFYETGYESEAEDRLSVALNRDIILDREILSIYKENNFKLLRDYKVM